MNIVFVSNYYNHHQSPFSSALANMKGVNYHFIETASIPEERLQLGYGMSDYPEYVIKKSQFDSNYSIVQKMIDDADVVITGSAPEILLENRKAAKKLIIRYSERIYKEPLPLWKYPIRFIKDKFRYRCASNEYLLCASAFSSYDYSITGRFINKAYKWGYFPETRKYDEKQLLNIKEPKSLLWAGRLIKYKHPELALLVAERLKKEGFDFSLKIIGTGEMRDELQKQITEKGLNDCVIMLGALTPKEVREKMEKSEIFLFTSDRREGWGAVLNEAMNSGCAVVADSEIGAVPYLIDQGIDGMIYKDIESLYKSVVNLLSDSNKRHEMGIKAYYKIIDLWNAEEATRRFILFLKEIMQNGECNLFADGPCSKAEIIKDGWYK